MHQLLQNQIP
uniref:Uncharacterized protein n=1 Tax=Rhizophora mucronata TaxID=61149 RepID=A0A2P2PQ85_RHIMU